MGNSTTKHAREAWLKNNTEFLVFNTTKQLLLKVGKLELAMDLISIINNMKVRKENKSNKVIMAYPTI